MTLHVGLAGFGSVGQEIAKRITDGAIPDVVLTAVAARNQIQAQKNARRYAPTPRLVAIRELPEYADVIVECATAEAFPEIAQTALRAGKTLVAVSVAGFLDCPDIEDLARRHGGRLRIASGALPGLDIIRGVKEGTIRRIKLTSSIHPDSLAREPYVTGKGFDFSLPPPQPVRVFHGTAREAAAAFPRHFNVAVALSLAGIGFDLTEVEVLADGKVPGPVHHVEVEADDASLTLVSRNRASANPRTARLVAPSVIATLRTYVSPLQVGT